jgi:response regulator RpfG family c-di-GMP phosphodiesterase
MPEPHIPFASVAHRVSAAWKAQLLKLRVKKLFWRQNLIARTRWYFRLPIDEIRDQQMDTLFTALQQESDSLKEALDLMKKMSARLRYYEEHIPRMRELKRQFELEALGVKPSNGKLHEVHGIIRP